ncbi:MAG: aromatic aminobenezylarsenical efflux permease ArsG family transporter [Candidatus Sumerlaeota bacterium]|nr:aromatic aminobenezylarsenical efflux permease ArsG family transporter [Candidatus Sumerlaeota bacterium]
MPRHPFEAAWACALWLGLLTAISPCPLTANIAAISYIGRRLTGWRQALLFGAVYVVGQTAAFVALGAFIVGAALAASQASIFLQRYVSRLLGPILILVGMVLLDLIRLNVPGGGVGLAAQRLADRGGAAGAGLLGLLIALSFCPTTAALFFGGLIPLAVERRSPVGLPLLYGIGAGLPVLVFSTLIAAGGGYVGRAFHRSAQFERWARRATGALFIGVGIFLSLTHVFGLFG